MTRLRYGDLALLDGARVVFVAQVRSSSVSVRRLGAELQPIGACRHVARERLAWWHPEHARHWMGVAP